MSNFKVEPFNRKITRVAMYSTSREGETLAAFKERTEKYSQIVIDGKDYAPTGEYERKYIPAYDEERWVTGFMEKHYA